MPLAAAAIARPASTTPSAGRSVGWFSPSHAGCCRSTEPTSAHNSRSVGPSSSTCTITRARGTFSWTDVTPGVTPTASRTAAPSLGPRSVCRPRTSIQQWPFPRQQRRTASPPINSRATPSTAFASGVGRRLACRTGNVATLTPACSPIAVAAVATAIGTVTTVAAVSAIRPEKDFTCWWCAATVSSCAAWQRIGPTRRSARNVEVRVPIRDPRFRSIAD